MGLHSTADVVIYRQLSYDTVACMDSARRNKYNDSEMKLLKRTLLFRSFCRLSAITRIP